MKRSLIFLAFALLIIFLFSALIGRYPAPGFLLLQRIADDELAQCLLFNLRLPRLLTALLLGMTLSAAGMVFQLLFSNPLVEPGFLGVSQGAAFGAAFSIVFLGGAAIVTQTSASVFALVGLGISYLLAHDCVTAAGSCVSCWRALPSRRCSPLAWACSNILPTR